MQKNIFNIYEKAIDIIMHGRYDGRTMNAEQNLKSEKPSVHDGGSAAQIIHFTERIKRMTEHLKKNKKDYSSRRGLMHIISKRKRLLRYLQRTDVAAYRTLIKEAGIRQSSR